MADSRTVLLLLLCGGIYACCGCRAGLPAGELAETSSASVHSATFSLPKDSNPTEVFTTTLQTIIVKTGDTTPTDKFHRSVYSWEPGSEPKLILGGHFLEVIRLSSDKFAATWYSENNENSPVTFATLNTSGLILQRLILPPSGPTGWGGCEGDDRYVVCIGNLPTMRADDKDYDEMGFSAVLVIDLEQRKTSWFPVKHRTHFHFNPARRLIYLADLPASSVSSMVEVFDLVGKERGKAHVLNMTMSPSGHFAESLQEDGADSWEIYDAASKKVLLTFGCDKPGCKPGDRYERHLWNPVFDGQFIALNGEGDSCDVYQSSPPHLFKSVPCSGMPMFDWSRDGREFITLEYKTGKFRRQPVNYGVVRGRRPG